MCKIVFRAVLIGVCVTVGMLSGCGKQYAPEIAKYSASATQGEGHEFVVIARTENCVVYRAKDADGHSVYWVESPNGSRNYCGGVATH